MFKTIPQYNIMELSCSASWEVQLLNCRIQMNEVNQIEDSLIYLTTANNQ